MAKRMTLSGFLRLISLAPTRKAGTSNMAWMKKTQPIKEVGAPISL